jgi:pimeloyl-ACP methyl ester carboxylesterase
VSDTTPPSPWALPPRAHAMYRGAVALDYGLRTALASVITAAGAGSVLAGGWRAERQRLEFLAERLGEEVGSVFAAPRGTTVRISPGRPGPLSAGRIELLRFESGYRTLNPTLEAEYGRHVNNATARAQHWRHDDGPRATLCVIHGFGASPAWLNTRFFSLREFFAAGWDIALFTLPFHGSRRSDGVPFNGIELFTSGMAVFSEAILHAIHDFRLLLDHLLEQGATRVGVTGLSLGGYTTALAAAVDPRLDFAVPNAAVTWVPPLLRSWFPANVGLAPLRLASRIPAELLERALSIHSPLSYPPQVARERRLIVAGLGDRLAPPEQSLMLWKHWERPELRWFAGSHVLHFGRDEYFAAMRQLMGSPE